MDTSQNSAVVGVFEDRDRAEQAVNDLRQAGFTDDQIGFAYRGEEGAQSGTTDISHGDDAGDAAGGAASGILTGGVLGGLLGAGAALLIPGFGPAIAGGILAATLGGAAIGATAGGLIGALTGMGVPEEEAQYYSGEFESGRIIVTVQADGRRQEAVAILQRYGAYDAATGSAQASTYNTGSGYDTTTTTTSTTASTIGSSTTGDHAHAGGQALATGIAGAEGVERVELREEELIPVKQATEAGQVQVRKTVREEEREIPVTLRREEVSIERNAVNRPIEGGEIGNLQDEVISVPIYEENVELRKQGRVAEEVVINKEMVQETETLRGTARREELDIQRTGDVRVQGDAGTQGIRDADTQHKSHDANA